jgi:hypothetical protein
MKDWIYKHYPEKLSYDVLRRAVREAWDAILPEELEALVDSMTARCQAVINAVSCMYHIRRRLTRNQHHLLMKHVSGLAVIDQLAI